MITQDQIRELRELREEAIQRCPNQAIRVIDYDQAICAVAPALLDAAEEAIRLRERVKIMQEAFGKVTSAYCDSVRAHDDWNPETDTEVINARTALASKEVA